MDQQIPTLGKVTPYPFQWEVAQNLLSHVRQVLRGEIAPEAAFINCYVSAGKTIISGIIARHCEKVGARLLILARTGELVEQDSAEVWNMGGKASVYSASLGTKSTHYNVVVGTEGTVANALTTDFAEWIPHVILVDECHEINWQDVHDNGDTQYSKIINHFRRINPKLAIIGMTGSPYRGVESIKGPFWKHEIPPAIDRKFLVDNGYIVPTIFGFGHDDAQYDLHEFAPENEFGTKDFSDSQLEQMHQHMHMSNTQAIMREVQEVMRGRLCALVTCAGKRHCEEAASCVPADESAIITDSTPAKERQQILRDAKKGVKNERGEFRYKYIFQIGCLTTGVNNVTWDTSVLLRRIGSLTLLTQLLGRGMRLLKPEHIEAGMGKSDHLVLDYTGTMDAMAELFNDPILEEAQLSHAKQDNQYIDCPICDMQNSPHARRCVGRDTVGDQPDNRCGHWWKFRTCDDQELNGVLITKGCGHKNDIAARECRNCGEYLIDPNAKLTRKHYSDEDWKPVIDWSMECVGKNSDGIKVTYKLDSYGIDGKQEVAEVFYWAIFSGGAHIWKGKFIGKHVISGLWHKAVNCKDMGELLRGHMWKRPKMITHRKNEKGESIVHGVTFEGGTLYTQRRAS